MNGWQVAYVACMTIVSGTVNVAAARGDNPKGVDDSPTLPTLKENVLTLPKSITGASGIEVADRSILSNRLFRRSSDYRPVHRTRPTDEIIQKSIEPANVSRTPIQMNAELLRPAPMHLNQGGEVLGFRDVVLYALRRNPSIEVAFWQAQDAKYAVWAARSARLPDVTLTAATGPEETRLEDPPDGTTMTRADAEVRLSQPLTDFGRTHADIQRARALRQSRDLQYHDKVEETLHDICNVYLDLLSTDQLRKAADENVVAHERILTLVEKGVRGGYLSEAELRQVEVRLDRAKSILLDTEEGYQRALSAFRRVTGLTPSKLTPPQLDLSDAYRLSFEAIDLFLIENHRYQSTLREIASLQHQISAAKRAYFPTLSVEVVGTIRDNVLGNVQTTTAGSALVSMSWGLFDGGRAIATAGQLRARRNETEARLRLLREELREDAYNVVTVLQNTQRRRTIVERQVAAARDVTSLYRKQFEAGRRTLLDFLDAQDEVFSAINEDIASRYELQSAEFAALRFENRLTATLAEQLELASALSGGLQ